MIKWFEIKQKDKETKMRDDILDILTEIRGDIDFENELISVRTLQ